MFWIIPAAAWSQTSVRSTSDDLEAQPDRVVAAVDPAKTTRLAATLPAWVSARHDVGAPLRDLRLDHLTVLLTRLPERERAFRQLLDDQQNRASPAYHQWLTPEQIGQRYGVTEHDLEAVTKWLTSQGLQVEQVSKSRTIVSLGGTVAQVEAALSVHFHRYALAADEAAGGTPLQRLSISAAPRVPAALAGVIQSFTGLTQVPVHPYGHAEVRRMADKPQYNYCPDGGSCSHFILPSDFATIFDLDFPAPSNNANASRIAIVGQSRTDPSDIQAFLSYAGVYASGGGANTLIAPAGTTPVRPTMVTSLKRRSTLHGPSAPHPSHRSI